MEKYYILNEELAKKYSIEKLKFFKLEDELECKEIGDGNLNNVFRITDVKTNKSVILKQALPYARTSIEMELTAQRCKTEAMALMEQRKYSSEMVPEVYHYDEDLCAMAMEDLKEYEILRTVMMEKGNLPNLAKQAAEFFANTLIGTSDINQNSKIKKDEVIRFTNKDLCELTEDLIFTQPTYNCKRNKVEKEIEDFINKNVYMNDDLKLEFSKLKYKFMTNAQALLHGDAHTGSIFVNETKTKFFDTEFAFYGPMGFDLGLFTGNLFMDYCYHKVNFNYDYAEKVMDMISDFINHFKIQFYIAWDKYSEEHHAKNCKGLKAWYLDQVLEDLAGYCGCEMIRRTIGSSHVKEMDNYQDINKKKEAQMLNVKMGIELLLNKEKFKVGSDYIELIEKNNIKGCILNG